MPHFEKMLYDNALLVPAYLEAHLSTGNPDHARIAAECCDWALREMVTPEGAFASAQDADSEGEEGRYFVWTPEELDAELGTELGAIAAAYYDVSAQGNFEDGKSVLWRPEPAREVAARLRIDEAVLHEAISGVRATLLSARERRVRPLTDDKVLAAWNGLMLSALAHAYQVLERPRYLQAAQRAASYVLAHMRKPDGRLLATARGGRAHVDACLDDYAFMIQGLIDLYESDFEPAWVREALALCEIVETRFGDRELGGYCTTGDGHEPLIARTKNVHDGALPSGTGVQALNLLRLGELCGKPEYVERARGVTRAQAALVNRHPRLFSQLLMAVDFDLRGPREIVISAERGEAQADELLRAVRRTFLPQRVVARADASADVALLPLLEGRRPDGGPPRAYVCRNFTCKSPVTHPQALIDALRAGD